MKKIKGLNKHPWASVVFETLELPIETIKKEIKYLNEVEKALGDFTTADNHFEKIFILKVILQYKEEEAKRDKI